MTCAWISLPGTDVSTGVERSSRRAAALVPTSTMRPSISPRVDLVGKELPGRDEAARLAARSVYPQCSLRIGRDLEVSDFDGIDARLCSERSLSARVRRPHDHGGGALSDAQSSRVQGLARCGRRARR